MTDQDPQPVAQPDPLPAPDPDRLRDAPALHTQRLEKTVFYIILALEIPSVVMTFAILIAYNAGAGVMLITMGGILLAPTLLLLARLKVRPDDERLRWSFFPFWRSSVAYDAIEGVEVIEVQAMRDYMGWGPKLASHGSMKGTFGAIARSGGAIRIARTDKKRDLVITCDDPETLAAQILDRAIGTQSAA